MLIRFLLKVRDLLSEGIREAARADMLASGIYRQKEPPSPPAPIKATISSRCPTASRTRSIRSTRRVSWYERIRESSLYREYLRSPLDDRWSGMFSGPSTLGPHKGHGRRHRHPLDAPLVSPPGGISRTSQTVHGAGAALLGGSARAPQRPPRRAPGLGAAAQGRAGATQCAQAMADSLLHHGPRTAGEKGVRRECGRDPPNGPATQLSATASSGSSSATLRCYRPPRSCACSAYSSSVITPSSRRFASFSILEVSGRGGAPQACCLA